MLFLWHLHLKRATVSSIFSLLFDPTSTSGSTKGVFRVGQSVWTMQKECWECLWNLFVKHYLSSSIWCTTLNLNIDTLISTVDYSNQCCFLFSSQLAGFIYACYVVKLISEEEDSCEYIFITESWVCYCSSFNEGLPILK